MNAAKWQIEYRIKQSIRLLESCAAQEQYRDPSLPYMDKVNSLNQINRHFGYMMIRYVDQNINVYSARGATSLASREYMQRLFTTGIVQVTDSFAAGADGVTLNYTVAVPLYWNEKSPAASSARSILTKYRGCWSARHEEAASKRQCLVRVIR